MIVCVLERTAGFSTILLFLGEDGIPGEIDVDGWSGRVDDKGTEGPGRADDTSRGRNNQSTVIR